jgi:hypothetical protein
MKKRVGRPKIGTQNVKGEVFTVRVTQPEAKQIKTAIRDAKLDKSEWLRKALLSAAGSDKSAS